MNCPFLTEEGRLVRGRPSTPSYSPAHLTRLLVTITMGTPTGTAPASSNTETEARVDHAAAEDSSGKVLTSLSKVKFVFNPLMHQIQPRHGHGHVSVKQSRSRTIVVFIQRPFASLSGYKK